jgi:hypothetical protein
MNWMAGKYVGLLYPGLPKLAENFYVVDARKVVAVVASALRQHLSACTALCFCGGECI